MLPAFLPRHQGSSPVLLRLAWHTHDRALLYSPCSSFSAPSASPASSATAQTGDSRRFCQGGVSKVPGRLVQAQTHANTTWLWAAHGRSGFQASSTFHGRLHRQPGSSIAWPLASSRCLSVLAWGRNVEGQCGVETPVLVTKPTTVTELHGVPVRKLVAGKLDSAAISRTGPAGTGDGEALTWGCGKAGKLGHGSNDAALAPCRVESLVGRTSVADVALGDHHSLFLDSGGSIWTCGENKEGQCGLGTPLEVIAMQHRKAFSESLRPSDFASSSSGSGGGGAGGRTGGASHASRGAGWRPRDQQLSSYLKNLMQQELLPHQRQHKTGMQLFLQQQQRQNAASRAGWVGMGSGGGSGGFGTGVSSGAVSSALGWGGFDLEGHLNVTGLQPGQLHTPMRIGRDQHPLSNLLHRQNQEPGSMQVVGSSGLENETVVSCAASRFFSLVVTGKGHVWTFGACYNGSLGSDLSWSTSAQQVSGLLAQVLADNGGAVQVAAGGTFCLALTAFGKVVVWGKVPGQELVEDVAATLPLSSGAIQGQRVIAGEVQGLPPVRHIAAGQSHALLSDGERVWSFGRLLDSTGKETSTACWSNPQELLHLPADGVQSIACGAHSSAVVSGDGQLYVWGRLLEFHHAESLFKRYSTSYASELPSPEDMRWQWAGFGADKPKLVEGLPAVRGVALGGWHALVLVE